LWIDPGRGYSITKATVVRKAGNKMYGEVLGGTDQYVITVSNVRLVNQDGVWVPIGGDIEYRTKVTGCYTSHQLAKIREMDITINPDHNALGSFDPNTVIREGAKVNVFDPGSKGVLQYIWRKGGKLVPDNGVFIPDAESASRQGKPFILDPATARLISAEGLDNERTHKSLSPAR
jgi:hypothetical protein